MHIPHPIRLATISAILFILPLTAHGFTLKGGEGVLNISGGEIIKNLYAGAGMVTVAQDIQGDALLAGGTVIVNGNVEQDLWVGGGTVLVNGDVGGDVRVAGGSVVVAGNVGGDLLAAGGTLTVLQGSEIQGDLLTGGGSVGFSGHVHGKSIIASSDITIAGTIDGNATAYVGEKFTIDNGAHIGGALTYTARKTAEIRDGATIIGDVKFNEKQNKDYGAWFARASMAAIIIGIFALSIMGLIALRLFPAKSTKVVQSAYAEFWPSLGWGFAFLVLTPVAIFILFATVIGFLAALVAGFAYMLAIIFGAMYAAIMLGSGVMRVLSRSQELVADWRAVILGAILITVLKLVPFIGWFAAFIFLLAALGSLLRYDWKLVRALREHKEI